MFVFARKIASLEGFDHTPARAWIALPIDSKAYGRTNLLFDIYPPGGAVLFIDADEVFPTKEKGKILRYFFFYFVAS